MYAWDVAAAPTPAFADLRVLPPLLIRVDSNEVLADDVLTLARKALLADVSASLTVRSAHFHVFQMMQDRLEGARRALWDGITFFADVLNVRNRLLTFS